MGLLIPLGAHGAGPPEASAWPSPPAAGGSVAFPREDLGGRRVLDQAVVPGRGWREAPLQVSPIPGSATSWSRPRFPRVGGRCGLAVRWGKGGPRGPCSTAPRLHEEAGDGHEGYRARLRAGLALGPSLGGAREDARKGGKRGLEGGEPWAGQRG